MKLLLLVAALALTLGGCASAATEAPATHHTPATGASRAMSWPVPDQRLTPGAVVACTLPRPPSQRAVTTAEKNEIAAAYGYTGPRGIAYLEFDHRVPFALCGSNGPDNVWPERADGIRQTSYVHNRKDQLEDVIIRDVHAGRLTLAQGQRVFLGDWRVGWCFYVHAPGVVCP
jgi:uncharacterized protein YceK